jgi:branched-chain amino acid transport system ATP-binding protein
MLEAKAISKSFRGLRAVHEASFAVPEGGIVGLIGPNGAGKTTIFNMVAGVFAPDSGEISFEKRKIQGLRADQICAAGIGRTFQIVKPFAGLSVLDNVMVGGFLRTNPVAGERSPSRSWRSSAWGRSGICPPPRSRCPIASAWKSRERSPRARACSSSTK